MSLVRFNTQRLLIRSVRAEESQAYGRINQLQYGPQEWYREWAEWENRGSLQLFIILRGQYRYGASTVTEGTVVGFIKIIANGNQVSFRTHPEFRRQGYMREALLSTFQEFVNRWRGRDLFVETGRDNLTVIRMMESFGLRGQDGNGFPGGSVFWRFGWATWRYAR
ncbi:hypothetical protein BKA64DRAFT_710725 [Cadophora sp. MPI-SDFR-AT-0126]|nr:hypothetical protein BKA64DRAFT_710725 [Leotiomycetes sp. MPI-SDFR-AT-0126]